MHCVNCQAIVFEQADKRFMADIWFVKSTISKGVREDFKKMKSCLILKVEWQCLQSFYIFIAQTRARMFWTTFKQIK